MTAPKMLTTKEVADKAGVKVSSIRQYRIRHTIPEPSYFGSTPYWTVGQINEWLKTRPNVGRPVKGSK